MGTKKKTTQNVNQTQTNAPPSWAAPTMQQLAGLINQGVNDVSAVPAYTGDFLAQPGAMQLAVPGGYADAAAMARSLVPQAQDAFSRLFTQPTFEGPGLEGSYQSFGGANPGGMDAAIAAAINPALRSLTEQILPNIQSSGIESGAYGGTRAMSALPAQALHDFSSEAQRLAATMTYQDFVDAQNRQQQAYGLGTERGLGVADTLTQRLGMEPDMLDAIMRMSGGAAELQAQGAAADQINRQTPIDNALQQYQYQIQRPFMGYDIATDLISKLAGNYGTQNLVGKTTTTEKTGGLGPALAGAMGLASMIAAIPTGGASLAATGAMGGGTVGSSLVSQLFGK